jgi:hypothetical protein
MRDLYYVRVHAKHVDTLPRRGIYNLRRYYDGDRLVYSALLGPFNLTEAEYFKRTLHGLRPQIVTVAES